MVIFDTNFMVAFFRELNNPVNDIKTSKLVEHVDDRVHCLIEDLGKSKTIIGIPTPVVAEICMRSGEGTDEIIATLSKNRYFRVLNFDLKAAIFCAEMAQDAQRNGNKRHNASPDITLTKLKYDRQIVSIARAHGVRKIYTNDSDYLRMCPNYQIEVVSFGQLRLSQEKSQHQLDLRAPVRGATSAAEITPGGSSP